MISWNLEKMLLITADDTPYSPWSSPLIIRSISAILTAISLDSRSYSRSKTQHSVITLKDDGREQTNGQTCNFCFVIRIQFENPGPVGAVTESISIYPFLTVRCFLTFLCGPPVNISQNDLQRSWSGCELEHLKCVRKTTRATAHLRAETCTPVQWDLLWSLYAVYKL